MTMKITKKSMVSGITRTMELDVTPEQMDRFYAGLDLVQNIFPNLTTSEREFLMTGITNEEWEEMFGDEEGIPDLSYDEDERSF